MGVITRTNQSGGSAMAGGADYQAEAYALVAAKILSEEALNWVQTGCNRIPVFVRMETGSGGDDLLISLQSGNKIELQAKKGLQRGDDLWDALIALAHAVHADTETYGLLLTTNDASKTVRDELKLGIERIGVDFDEYDQLHDIVREFVRRLKAEKLDPKAVCKRLFVRAWNFEPGSQGEESTLSALRKVIAQPQQAGSARSVLVSDGMDVMTLRGGRDAPSLSKILQQNGIPLSSTARNMLVAREAYMQWCVERNSKFFIPILELSLPIEKAWVRLSTMGKKSSISAVSSLEEQIRIYHEWYRLAENRAGDDDIAVELAAREHRLLVVVAGPGAGKSTLQRRLARNWSLDSKILLHVSLRRVSQLIGGGATLDDAVKHTALDGFGGSAELQTYLWQNASCLLADGLDETDPYREEIAHYLNDWGRADNKRRVIVTTRPVGHNAAWFVDWEHVELLPLKESDVRDFAQTVFMQIPSVEQTEANSMAFQFLESLEQSHAARLASRNPLLLGFLLALHIQKIEIGISRYRLFAEILDRIGKQSRDNRPYQHQMNEAETRRAVDCLGWILMQRPALLELDLTKEMGIMLAGSFDLTEFQGEQKVRQAIDFWEERGLIESVGVGGKRTYTFVYMTFQEFAAARYLERLSKSQFEQWVEQHYMLPKYREMLLLTGGTSKAKYTVETLLNADVPNDPVANVGLLAAEVLSVMENAPETLLQRVIFHLEQRLTSSVPSVVYEAGDSLIAFAPVAPELIGNLGHKLSTHEQKWTREVACGLSLLAGYEFVAEQALIDIYPKANDSAMVSARGGGLSLNHNAIVRELLVRGGEYLLRKDVPRELAEIVKQKYAEGKCSGGTANKLGSLLSRRFPLLNIREISPFWRDLKSNFDLEARDRITEKADKAFLEAAIEAAQSMRVDKDSIVPASKMGAIAAIFQVIDMMNSPVPEYDVIGKRPLWSAFIEVLKGVIYITALDPAQVISEAEEIIVQLETPRQVEDLHYRIYHAIEKTVEFQGGRDIDWTLAANGRLEPAPLSRALQHPSYMVCRFAVLLLMNCFGNTVVRHYFSQVIEKDSSNTLFIVSQAAKHIWGKEAEEKIHLRLEQIEQNMTAHCAPLVKTLGDICDASSCDRVTPILIQALSSAHVELVKAGLEAAQKLSLDASLQRTIQDRYLWWIQNGPAYPVGGGAVPPNAATTLLDYLLKKECVSDTELLEAVKVKRKDVQDMAISELCRRMGKDDALAAQVLSDVFDDKLPLEIFDKLSELQPVVCKKHFELIIENLDADDQKIKLSVIYALGGGWAGHRLVEGKLRSLLYSEDTSFREAALSSLRRHQTRDSIKQNNTLP